MEQNDFRRFCGVIVFTLIMHLATMPILLYGQEFNAIRIVFLVFHNFFTFLVYFFMFLVKTKQGFVGYNEQTSSLLKKNPNKYCMLCDNFKPERAHHCSRCKQCVRKMDHHCMWLGSCVNNDNLGHFIRMLLFIVLSFLNLFTFSIYSICTKNEFEFGVVHRILTVFAYMIAIVSFLFFLAFGYFFIERFLYVLKNLTYLEGCSLETHKENNIQPCLIKSPYDLGWIRNLRTQLGKPYFLYMYGEKGDGLSFEKTYECDQWPPHQYIRRRHFNEISLPV